MIIIKEYTEELVKNSPDLLFVFGENEKQKGTKAKGGGQAIIRPYPNTFGFRVQKDIGLYWTDDEYVENRKKINEDVTQLINLLSSYNQLVFPFYGIGTGRANMLQNCPQTFFYLCYKLQKEFGFNNIGSFEAKHF